MSVECLVAANLVVEMKERLAAEGAEAFSNTPEEFASLIQKDTDKWAKVIKEGGIKPA
jgi:tripartite-type tricarboxylate transporter receptor subunit TctC